MLKWRRKLHDDSLKKVRKNTGMQLKTSHHPHHHGAFNRGRSQSRPRNQNYDPNPTYITPSASLQSNGVFFAPKPLRIPRVTIQQPNGTGESNNSNHATAAQPNDRHFKRSSSNRVSKREITKATERMHTASNKGISDADAQKIVDDSFSFIEGEDGPQKAVSYAKTAFDESFCGYIEHTAHQNTAGRLRTFEVGDRSASLGELSHESNRSYGSLRRWSSERPKKYFFVPEFDPFASDNVQVTSQGNQNVYTGTSNRNNPPSFDYDAAKLNMQPYGNEVPVDAHVHVPPNGTAGRHNSKPRYPYETHHSTSLTSNHHSTQNFAYQNAAFEPQGDSMYPNDNIEARQYRLHLATLKREEERLRNRRFFCAVVSMFAILAVAAIGIGLTIYYD